MRKCHRQFRQKSKNVPAESWGTFVGYCVPQLVAVCVLYTEIKISALFEYMVRFITKLNLALLLGHPCMIHFISTFHLSQDLRSGLFPTQTMYELLFPQVPRVPCISFFLSRSSG